MASGNSQSADEIADLIKENQQKVNHHGKRADGIVKSMLQHSRISSGQKELTDLNTLCEEYVRLAYHGFKAKDKSFNANFEIHFDPSLPKIDIVRQDIGRVILNLINNAFYAVSEKSKSYNQDSVPTVSVSTKRVGDRIEIRVDDNGNGIPEAIREKIFQPFFTTKQAGQGTGLGLSLSYDIIKAHGGTLEANSEEGVGSKFIIHLPT
jgi:two-component system NtrC family sensor kinase